MEERSALIAYATETGNAFDFAEEIGRLLERIHFSTHVCQLDSLNPGSLRDYAIVLIVVSTTGQGDLPTNGRSFWKTLLRKKLPPTYLNDVRFSTFGLGDSSYPKFNWAARKIHKRLLQLGASEIYPRGEADQQHDEGLDASFVPWSSDLRNDVLNKHPLPTGVEPIPESDLLEPKWKLVIHPPEKDRNEQSGINGDSSPVLVNRDVQSEFQSQSITSTTRNHESSTASRSLAVELVENHRVTPHTHWQDVRHVVFTSKSPAAYAPGDVLTIHPKNIPGDVDQILRQMDWVDVADMPVHFTRSKVIKEGSSYTPPPMRLHGPHTTLRSLLTAHLDITAIPRRAFFSFIAHFTDDQFHKDRLLEFTKPEYIDELYDYTTRPRRSILEVLQEFESVKIPWQWAASVLPELRGRQFSIASGGILKSTLQGFARFELVVAIVKYKTVIKKVREGVCTRYLASLPKGTQLNVSLQKGDLAIKIEEAKRPVVLIGPGTGIAPLRSLIWERQSWLQTGRPKSESEGLVPSQREGSPLVGKTLLFFGCRSQHADYFFRHEWEDLSQQMPLEVHTAFSRDQDQKEYVQDLIQRESNSVYTLLYEDDGLVYVCGSSGKMPHAVRASLVDAFVKQGKMNPQAATKYLEDMEKEGRYKQETW